jgi:hypothetical protein
VDFALTDHARDMLSERGIDLEWVRSCLREPMYMVPDRRDRSLTHALMVMPALEGRVLRVVFDASVRPPRVVTAFFDRRLRGRL